MNNGINLLQNKHTLHQADTKLLVYLRAISVALLSFLFISSVSLFFLNQTVNRNDLQIKENTLLANYTGVNSRIVKLFLIHDRLSAIAPIFSKRVFLAQTIRQLNDIIPSEVVLDSFQMDKQLAQLTVSSSSLENINTFLDGLVLLKQEKKILKSVVLVDIGLSEKNKFFASIKLQLL